MKTIAPFLLMIGLIYLGPCRSEMTGCAHLVNNTRFLTIIRRLRSLKGLILIVILDLGFLVRTSSLTPETVNNRIPLAITATSTIVSLARSHGTLRTGPSLTPVSSAIIMILPRPIST